MSLAQRGYSAAPGRRSPAVGDGFFANHIFRDAEHTRRIAEFERRRFAHYGQRRPRRHCAVVGSADQLCRRTGYRASRRSKYGHLTRRRSPVRNLVPCTRDRRRRRHRPMVARRDRRPGPAARHPPCRSVDCRYLSPDRKSPVLATAADDGTVRLGTHPNDSCGGNLAGHSPAAAMTGYGPLLLSTTLIGPLCWPLRASAALCTYGSRPGATGFAPELSEDR